MGKGKHQGGGRARSAEEIEADEGAPAKDDRKFGGRGVGGQSATAGMMPPSSSEEESEEEEETQQRGLGGQSATAGMLPPNSSDEEEEAAPAPKSKKTKKPWTGKDGKFDMTKYQKLYRKRPSVIDKEKARQPEKEKARRPPRGDYKQIWELLNFEKRKQKRKTQKRKQKKKTNAGA